MDDSLRALEERLEQLVPKGLSDQGRERMEEQIDEWAAAVDDGSSTPSWKWGIGAAAALVTLVAVGWGGREATPALVSGDEPAAPPEEAAVVERTAPGTQEELLALMTLSVSRSVQARTDRGWVMEPGSDRPHRVWSYEVTREEELMDEQSGYAVRVVSQHEEWVPVALNQF